MKDQKFNKGIESLRKIKLPEGEKQAMLLRILENVESKQAVQSSRMNTAPFSILGFRVSYKISYSLATFLIIVIVSTGASFAAENAVPGDVLYPVKINFNERVIDIIQIDSQKKILWETKKIGRRLGEAEVLAVSGKLDAKKYTLIEEKLERATEKFKESIDNLDIEDESVVLALEADFNARLTAHSKILEHIGGRSDDKDKERVLSIAEKAREKIIDRFNKNKFAQNRSSQTESAGASLMAEPVSDMPIMLKSKGARGESFGASSGLDKVISPEAIKRREIVQKFIERTEKELEKVENKGVSNKVRDNIYRDGRVALEEAKGLLNRNDNSIETLIKSESAVKQADISIKQGSKLKFKENKENSR